MLKRPKSGDDEDDILQMQEEYLKEKSKDKNFEPAAKVVDLRVNNPTTTKLCNSTKSRKPSKYAELKGLKNHAEQEDRQHPTTSLVGDILEKNTPPDTSAVGDKYVDDTVYFPVVIPSILGKIVERNPDTSPSYNFKAVPSEGFPPVYKCKLDINNGIGSVFSRHIKQLKLDESNEKHFMDVDNSNNPINDTVKCDQESLLNIPMKSYIVTSDEADVIHRENLNTLSTMSEAEILDEQNRLMSMLSPSLVSFLKSRRNVEPTNMDHLVEGVKDVDMKTDSEEDILWDNDVFSHPEINKWLHFDSFEEDKLAWMKCIKESELANVDQPYEARFNLKGYLLPYIIEYNEETKSLFHHGDEPHRPGYSLTELFELSRSTIIQQRAMALNTIAGILDYYMAGTYKDVITLPLSKIFFILRISLDDNKPALLEPTLKAMRNLFYNKIDEASLDALIGFEHSIQQPCLENDKSEISELDSHESELKDFHLAEIDLVTAALRTDIVQRIHYILNCLKPSFNCVQFSLQILIRLARDSVETAKSIVDTEHLMSFIIQNFIPVTSINFAFEPQIVYNGKPVIAALKFLRVLSLQSKDICEILVNKYNIINPILEYISSTVNGTYGLRIQIESFCMLTNLLNYGFGIERAADVLPIVLTYIYKHVDGTDVFVNSSIPSATHAAVILQLINVIIKLDHAMNIVFKNQVIPLIFEGTCKWLMQTSKADSFTCAHLRLLCSALDCSSTLIKNEPSLISALSSPLKEFASSPGYSLLASKLVSSSNLLSGIEKSKFHIEKNLASLNASVIDGNQRVLPVLNIDSPIPLFASLFKLLENVDVSEIFMKPLTLYIDRLKLETPSLCDNWFTRMETDFAISLITVLVIRRNLSETEKDILYVLASKLCYILRADKIHALQFLFNNVVFNRSWFTADRLVNVMSISDSNLTSLLTSVDEIKSCYSEIIDTGYKDTGPNVVLKNWQQPILPRDWIYLPILNLYSKNQELITATENNTIKVEVLNNDLTILCSLQWIVFNEICFSDLLTDIDMTDRFCRIMCVFLCDNSLFLNTKIQGLLKCCTQILFKRDLNKRRSFDFDKPLVGLHNFQDFYTQLLEQFQSVSYGDYNFAACVLVPLAQKHNVKWRKLLWSEYAGCLRALDCPEDLLCYEMNDYFYPDETDESLIKSYFRALSGNLLRPGTIAHRIASHHVQAFKAKSGMAS